MYLGGKEDKATSFQTKTMERRREKKIIKIFFISAFSAKNLNERREKKMAPTRVWERKERNEKMKSNGLLSFLMYASNAKTIAQVCLILHANGKRVPRT